MRSFTLLLLALAALFQPSAAARAQTPEDITKLVERLVPLDSIDLAKEVKFRPGLEPSLYTLDADVSQMRVLENPYEVQGRATPAAAGWYRISFVVPETIGKFPLPKGGYNLGIESNFVGSWEAYTYINGKPAGLWSKDGMLSATNQPPTAWVSNAPMPTRPGDEITVSILATASPLGRGSPEGFGLRHLRLRFALAHTASRTPFYAALHRAREQLGTLQGDELTALRERLKEPLAHIDAVFASAESGKLDDLSKAMMASSKEVAAALKK